MRGDGPSAAALFDPRRGDAEDDASSTKQRSLLAIAGSLLAEISLPKLLFAWVASILVPGILLGLTPLVATAWLTAASVKLIGQTGLWTALLLVAVAGLGWIGWRPLLRTAESNFWALNALAVQPAYALCREAIRHLVERLFGRQANAAARVRLRAASAVGAGVMLCVWAIWIATLAWPASRWIGNATDLLAWHRLAGPAMANAIVLVSAYLAVAALVWGIADAGMNQAVDLAAFDTAPAGQRTWRVAHLSDIHVVGERYGFRLESGRGGPRGNDRLERVLTRLEAIHAVRPLDLVLISGDLTDAGRSVEWAELLDIIARHPELASRTLVVPGNHDVNIIDRANPARLDLPFSAGKRLREMRALSAIAALQGDRVRVVDRKTGRVDRTLAEALAAHRARVATFADRGTLRSSVGLGALWEDLFPMVFPPDGDDGLGVVMLNSNAQSSYSFTNALGMIDADQARRLGQAASQFPRARWIVALHHHLMEYPMAVEAFSERIGTALINGTWFARLLKGYSERVVIMHGHRHIDWIGRSGGLKIVSAPSPVMGTPGHSTHFYIHAMAAGPDGQLLLLAPERVDIAAADEAGA